MRYWASRARQRNNDSPDPRHSLTYRRMSAKTRGRYIRTGMTAFNEVPVLEEEGRKGNSLVGAAPLKLFFSPRGVPYENMRVTALRPTSVIKRYESTGWTYVLSWFPFHYFTRQAHSDE